MIACVVGFRRRVLPRVLEALAAAPPGVRTVALRSRAEITAFAVDG